jgi:hypothetical protein
MDMGRLRIPIAVGKLIAKLDDPSSEVCEEAAYALGRIGSPEAVDVLIERLEQADSVLKPQIAKSLRFAGSIKGVEPLMKTLFESDRETQVESARALGEIGDRRAVPCLLELLQHTEDPKVALVSGEALAKLRAVAAIYDLLPRMKTTSNPVLKRSLAAAIGDLLGEPGGFYRFLAAEEEEPGIELESVFERLRKNLGKIIQTNMRQNAETLRNIIGTMEEAFEKREHEQAAKGLIDYSVGMCAIRHGIEHGEDAEVMMETLVWHDEKLAIGMWYLGMLLNYENDENPKPVERIDVLIGIYFIDAWLCNAEIAAAGPPALPEIGML